MIKEGKILKALSGFYYVQCQEELITCRARGNFRNDNITPLVGDDVKIQMSDNNTGYVVEILERKNELLRPKVSNIDYSIIIVSVKYFHKVRLIIKRRVRQYKNYNGLL